jgi:hypothetical protein
MISVEVEYLGILLREANSHLATANLSLFSQIPFYNLGS